MCQQQNECKAPDQQIYRSVRKGNTVKPNMTGPLRCLSLNLMILSLFQMILTNIFFMKPIIDYIEIMKQRFCHLRLRL